LTILRHLPVFVAVAQEGQIKRAAERLNIAQSAVSRRIKSLEDELGVALFERRRDGSALTQPGKEFRDNVNLILKLADRAVKHTRSAAQGQVGLLRVGFIEIALREPRVAHALRRYRSDHPNVEVTLVPMWSGAQLDRMRAGLLDAGFHHRAGPEMDGLERMEVFSQEMVLALPSRHRLARKRTVKLADLRDVEFIMPSRTQSPRLCDHLISCLRANDIVPRISSEIVTSETLVSLVASGNGVGFVEEQRGRNLPEGVVVRRVVDFSFRLHLDLVWRREGVSPALRQFIDYVGATRLPIHQASTGKGHLSAGG
jgi:DNA-binding transcriptional LysR family regulator